MNKLYITLIIFLNTVLAYADDLKVSVKGSDVTKTVISYAGGQDVTGTATTSADNKTLNMSGNTWKAIDLTSIDITADTVIEFDISCAVQADVQGIGFSSSLAISSATTFKFWGTQTWGIEDYNNYWSSAPNVKSYSIPVGQHYTGNYRYLTFVLDHDVSNPNAQMTISNIVIRDASETQPGNDWTPEDIASGLQGWYDAADAATIVKSGSAVSQWNDKSGQGVNLSQATSSKQPQSGTSINGLNAFDFTGDELKSSTNPFGSSINDAFVFMVAKTDATNTGTAFSLTGTANAANRWNAHLGWGSTGYFDAGGTSGDQRINKNGWTSSGQVWMAGLYNSNTDQVQELYKNGALFVGDSNAQSVNTVGNIAIGSDGSSTYQDMTLGEVVIINGTVSVDLRQRVEGYLAHKWGLTDKLPASHPYKSAAPQKSNSWTPEDIASGLQGWYDATDAATIVKSGSAVSQWNDKSGQGVNLSQATSSKQPQSGANINSVPALNFTGDELKSSTNPFGSSINDAFVFMVAKTDATNTGTAFSLTGTANAANRWNAHLGWGSTGYFDAGGTSGDQRINKNGWTSSGQVWMAGLYNSNTDQVQELYKNGALFVGDSNAQSVNTVGNIAIGSDGSSTYQDMTLGEVIIINGTVSVDLRQRVEGYLAHKWGLTDKLPASHPYKSTSPVKEDEQEPSYIAGIEYKYYENDGAGWDVLPNFAALTAKTVGTTDAVNTSVAERDHNYGIVFKGFINIPSAGDWTFYTRSDDGSKLYFGNDLVVSNDGLHGAVERSGTRSLAAGMQAFKLEYFERGGGEIVEFYWEGPGQTKGQVPAAALFKSGQSGSGVSGTFLSQAFTFDGVNRRDTMTLADGSVWDYSYDGLGNLEQAHKAHPSDPSQDLLFNYAFNDIGDRKTSNENGVSKTYTKNNIQQYTSINEDGTITNLTYDEAGNPDQMGDWNLTWDAEDRLKTMTNSITGEKLEFGYDYRGFRVWKKVFVNGNDISEWIGYIYDGNLVTEEIDLQDNQKIIRSYTWGLDPAGTKQQVGGIGALLSMEQDNKTYHVVSDAGGNVTSLLESKADGSLETANTYEYGPFGQVIAKTENVDMPYQFNTKYTDEETGLVYYGYRYYNANHGRWLNRDPIGVEGGINIYNSVSNNMVNGFSGGKSYNIGMEYDAITLQENYNVDSFGKFKFGPDPRNKSREAYNYIIRIFFHAPKNIISNKILKEMQTWVDANLNGSYKSDPIFGHNYYGDIEFKLIVTGAWHLKGSYEVEERSLTVNKKHACYRLMDIMYGMQKDNIQGAGFIAKTLGAWDKNGFISIGDQWPGRNPARTMLHEFVWHSLSGYLHEAAVLSTFNLTDPDGNKIDSGGHATGVPNSHIGIEISRKKMAGPISKKLKEHIYKRLDLPASSTWD